MIVIANNTESKLLKDLKRCVKESPAQKCFCMEFSKCGIPKQPLFEAFLQAMEELPNSYTAQVYLCCDKDIFIIMRELMQRQFLAFVKKLSVTLEAPELTEMTDVFEVGFHWGHLEKACKYKIESLENEKIHEEEERKKAEDRAAQQATKNALMKLDPILLKDFADRRHVRNDIMILVVDDDQLSRTLVGNVLSKDFKITYAKDGAEALDEYLICAPDVMFLDIGLPDISGHEVLECLFQIDPDAYVIMFSGRKDKENIIRALETGAQGFVGKPFTRNKLFEYIQKSPFVLSKNILDPPQIVKQ